MQDAENVKIYLDNVYTKIALLVIVIAGLFFFYKIYIVSPVKQKLIGNTAPDFHTVTIDEKPFHLNDYIGQKVILINFWATWCGSCEEEIPYLNAIYNALDPDSFMLIGVMEDTQYQHKRLKDAYGKFTNLHPIRYPVIVDPDNSIAEAYGTFKIPETFIIDLSGSIFYKHAGAITKTDVDYLYSILKQISY